MKTTDAIANEAVSKYIAIQKPTELKRLLDLVQKRKPKTLMEIGTARGGTFFALCQTAPTDATLISVDLPGGKFGGGYSRKNIPIFRTFSKNGQKLHFLLRDSHNDLTKYAVKRLLKGRGIDFLMIDGDHTYPGVKRDWELYKGLVNPNGIIAFHDIVPHPQIPECQVDRLWREIRGGYKYDEFIDTNSFGWDHEWGGIGVLYPGVPVKNEQGRDLEEYVKIEKGKALLLNLNPIPNKQPNFFGMGNREHPNVDIVHDMEEFPWPFADNSCHTVIAHSVVHHIKPWLFVRFMDELWRIIRPGGQLALAVPYAGSPAFWADPMACNGVNETTFFYFSIDHPDLYQHYTPKPWRVEKGSPQWVVGGGLEILMRPVKGEGNK